MYTKPRLSVLTLALIVFSFSAALAQSNTVSVSGVFADPAETMPAQKGSFLRGQPAGGTIDIFATLLDNGNADDAVTSVTTPIASSANIVFWFRGNQMTRDLPLPLPQGQSVTLGSQTQFLRLYGLSRSFKDGDTFPVTFHFRNAPDAVVDVVVKPRP